MEFSKNPLVSQLQRIYQYSLSHKKEAAIIVAAVLGLTFLGIGYSFYRVKVQQRAQLSFSEALKYYDAKVILPGSTEELEDFNTVTFKSEDEKWANVVKVFQDAYSENKGATIAPFFRAYQSDALVRLGDLSQAIKVLKDAIKFMPNSELKSYYQVKNALMCLDSENKDFKEEGLSLLKGFALDQKSSIHDMVLYYLGEHYFDNKNFDEARNYWNQLTLMYSKSSEKPSWWAEQARPKLKLISSK